MMVSSKARYDTELLEDVQQVITEKLVSAMAQTAVATPYRHVPRGKKSCFPQGTSLIKETRGTEMIFPNHGTFTIPAAGCVEEF